MRIYQVTAWFWAYSLVHSTLQPTVGLVFTQQSLALFISLRYSLPIKPMYATTNFVFSGLISLWICILLIFMRCQLPMSQCFLPFIWMFSTKAMSSISQASIVLCSFLCLLKPQDMQGLKVPYEVPVCWFCIYFHLLMLVATENENWWFQSIAEVSLRCQNCEKNVLFLMAA